MDVVITCFELSQKILDLQIICSRKDIEIYKLKKQINDMVNITVLNIKDANGSSQANAPAEPLLDTNGSGVALGEPLANQPLLEKTIKVKVKECGDCRSEDRRSFPTKGYKCEDEECMNFK